MTRDCGKYRTSDSTGDDQRLRTVQGMTKRLQTVQGMTKRLRTFGEEGWAVWTARCPLRMHEKR
ncbi:unnamed protein product, partial [Staurois parvus]